jgi:hypothetical protein
MGDCKKCLFVIIPPHQSGSHYLLVGARRIVRKRSFLNNSTTFARAQCGVAGYPPARPTALSSIDKGLSKVIAGKAQRRRADMQLGEGARLSCDLGCIRIR